MKARGLKKCGLHDDTRMDRSFLPKQDGIAGAILLFATLALFESSRNVYQLEI
jgi:hypothetical protein